MKSKFLIFSLVVFALYSCKKEKKNDTPTNTTPTNPGLICKVDGSDWSADKNKTYNIGGDDIKGVEIEVDYEDSSIFLTSISVNGTDTTLIFGSVNMKKTGVLGNYPFSIEEGSAMLFVKKLVPNTSIALNLFATLLTYFDEEDPGTVTGSLNITKFDASTKTISGDFNFTQTPPTSQSGTFPKITVTNGNFVDVVYTEYR